MKIAERLIWLLRQPMPFPKGVFFGALLGFLALSLGVIFGVGTLIVAQVVVLSSLLGGRVFGVRSKLKGRVCEDLMLWFLSSMLCLLGLFGALVLFASDMQTLQRIVTLFFLGRFLVGAASVFFLQTDKRHALKVSNGKGPQRLLWYQIVTISAGCQAMLNEVFAAHLSDTGWMIALLMMPLALYPLRHWTFIAMYPWEDVAD